MKSNFQAPAILNSIAYTKDKGLRIGFVTNELSDEDKLIASQFHQQFGWVLFSANQFTDAEIPTGDASDESKSPSQRLRNCLYVLWKKRDGSVKFNDFYVEEMERFINKVKERIAVED